MISTLIDALSALPRGNERGFRFITSSGEEHFHSYENLEREAYRRAAQFAALGLKKGERVALVIADPEQFVLCFLGATVAGLVSVPIYPRASFNFKTKKTYSETVSHIVRSAGARLLLTQESSLAATQEALLSDTGLERVVTLEEFLSGSAPATELPALNAEDLCFLQFTSGSTSLPKGVMVTHGNLVANAQAFLGPQGLALRKEDLAIAWLPLYHDMGLIGFVLGTLICDLPTVLLPTHAFVRRPGIWMEAMSKYGGTITFAPNFAYALATRRTRDEDMQELDLRKLRVAGCGAEPINATVMREFCQRFAAAGLRSDALLPCYGMAEATLAITFHDHGQPIITDKVCASALGAGRALPPQPDSDTRTMELVGCGHAFPGHELGIIDDTGKLLPERCVGEIITRGPSITAGYFGQPEASASGYRNGWLHTGDLGYLAEGQLYICGRLKDLIIIRGVNHYPQDIENAVAEVPGVQRNAAVAFSILREGEERLIICAEGRAPDAVQIKRAVATKVAEAAGLKVDYVAVVQVGSLPKTSSGKVQRRKTKAQFEAGELEEHVQHVLEAAIL